MSETCICGHDKEGHGIVYSDGPNGPVEQICECLVNGCWCRERSYRPVLDWPDAEGLWWCNHLAEIRMAKMKAGSIRYHGHTQREMTELLDGPARFTRLLEANPFEAAGERT